MLVFRLTIQKTIARVCAAEIDNSEGDEVEPFAVDAQRLRFHRWGRGWDSLDTKAQRLLAQFASAT